MLQGMPADAYWHEDSGRKRGGASRWSSATGKKKFRDLMKAKFSRGKKEGVITGGQK